MFGGLFVVSLICTIGQLIKEQCEPVIPAENWANKDLIHKDNMSGISPKEFQRNLANGKYKMTESYSEPHRDENGKIIIQNCKLYRKDLLEYGSVQTMKWVKQGKYNLEGEALGREHQRIKKEWEELYKLL